jgi:ribosomal-protein-alanine N-acetyltransferase
MQTRTSTTLQIEIFNAVNAPTLLQQLEMVNFLYEHLGPYGDPKPHISNAIDYACSMHQGQGGFVLVGRNNDGIQGVVVVNQTGMSGYIPENILVYIAVSAQSRGKGYGKQLMLKALDFAKGDVALHVEPDNPARKLYERLGFTNKYLEMRYKPQHQQ